MEIRAAGPDQELQPVAVTMRTPGGDFELAVGFLFTEGLIGPGDVQRVAYCDNLPGEDQRYNVVSVHLRRPFDAERVRRNFYATSSCGICGKAALDDVEVSCGPVAEGPQVSADVVASLPAALRSKQALFEKTGGLHAAGLFTPDGDADRGARGRRPAQRRGQGDRRAGAGRPGPALREHPAGERPRVVRDRAEGGGGRHPDRERGERPVVARGRGGRTVRDDDRRVRPRRPVQRVHRIPSASSDDQSPSRGLGRTFQSWITDVRRIRSCTDRWSRLIPSRGGRWGRRRTGRPGATPAESERRPFRPSTRSP